MKLSVSYLSSSNYKDTIRKIEATNCDYIHVDLMDGKFVSQKNFTISEVTKLLNKVNKKLDIHLMVENPIKYIKELALLNTEYITFHLECNKNVDLVINEIKKYGLKCGVSLKPNTDINLLQPYLKELDLILVMSVEPGMGGQQFIDNSIIRLQKLVQIKKDNNYQYILSVDGGINDLNINLIKDAGADMVAVGSFITNSYNYQNEIDKLK